MVDDTTVYTEVTATRNQIKLHKEFGKSIKWGKDNQTEINDKKTVSASVTRTRSPLMYLYSINENSLSNVNEYEYPGIILQLNLSWSRYVDGVCSKAMMNLGSLKQSL